MLFSSPTLMVVTVGLQFVAVGVCNRVKNLYIKESTLTQQCLLGLQVQLKYAHKKNFIGYLNPNDWKSD